MAFEEHPTAFVITLSVVLSVEGFVGFCFNITIFLYSVLRRNRQGTKSGNFFILNLNLVDAIICLTAIPLTVTVLATKDEYIILCFLKEGAILFVSTASSVNILLISIDRYVAIVAPTRKIFHKRSTKYFLLIIWGTAVVGLVLPFACLSSSTKWNEFERMNLTEVVPCRYIIWTFWPYFTYDLYYIVLFFITVIVVIICYYAVVRVARKRLAAKMALVSASLTIRRNTKEEERKRQERRITKMTLAIVLSFSICWGPHVIVTLVHIGLPGSSAVDMVQFFCLVLAYSTTVIHPVIYTLKQDRNTSELRSKLISTNSRLSSRFTSKISPMMADSNESHDLQEAALKTVAVAVAVVHDERVPNSKTENMTSVSHL